MNTADVKERLITLGGRHITAEGVLIVVSREFRSQFAEPQGRSRHAVATLDTCRQNARTPDADEAERSRARKQAGVKGEAQRGQTIAD